MRVPRFFRRRYWDRERSREIDAYLQIETDQNMARGMTEGDARDAARKKFGNRSQILEEIYRMNTVGFLESIWQDLRYGMRLMRLSPGFALIAIASLALGIGANTAMFQLIDAVRLRSLAVKDPATLAEARITNFQGARGNFTGWHSDFNNPLWEHFRDHQTAFSSVFAWSRTEFNIAPGGEERRVLGLYVSGEFFHTLGIEPALGRVFATEDDRRGCGAPGVVISNAFWKREFGGDPAAIGKTLNIEMHPFQVIGVTPPEFTGLEVGRSFDLAVLVCSEPLLRTQSRMDEGREWWLLAMGRLRPGWSFERTTAALRAQSAPMFEATLPAKYPPTGLKKYLEFKLGAIPAATGISYLRETYSNPLLILLAITALVLLIACANLANLMLARSSAREREISVRLALGASAGRVARQLLAESFLLAIAGAAAGVFLAQEMSRFLVNFIASSDSVYLNVTADARVLGFTAGLAVLTCILFGLAPALGARRSDPSGAMKGGSRGAIGMRGQMRLRRMLVASQIALGLVLVVGALLFTRSLRNLMTVETGFRQSGVLIVQLNAQRLKLTDAALLDLHRRLVDDFRALPGVDAAGEASITPMSGNESGQTIEMGTQRDSSYVNWVGPGYFQTLAMRFLTGREFDAHDGPGSPRVAIVNEAFARRFTGGANPVGQRFHVDAAQPGQPVREYEIVGLVSNAKYDDLRENFSQIVYFPVTQYPLRDDWPQIMVHGNTSLSALTASIREAVRQINPNITFDFTVLQTQVRGTLTRERLVAMLSNFFGVLAALLVGIGLYGVTSYTVAMRRSEIGVRIALGAARKDVIGMIFRETAVLLAAGVAVGLILSAAGSRAAASLLYGLRPYDPAAMALAIAGLAGIALAAAYVPAQRAARLDPMTALREE